MELKYFILRRGLIIIPTLLGLTILTYLILLGFSPVAIWRSYNPSQRVPPEASTIIAQMQSLGFSVAGGSVGTLHWTNYLGMYFSFVEHLFTGNWGFINLPQTGPTLSIIEMYLPNTVQLALAATIVSLIIAIPLGTYIGARPNSPADQVGRIFSLSGYALPAFWLAYLLIVLFGDGVGIVPYVNIFPYSWLGVVSIAQNSGMSFNTFSISQPTHILLLDSLLAGKINVFTAALEGLTLPVATVTYGILAGILRFMRSGMVDASGQEFIKTARAKGVPEKMVIKKHIRKNALLPTVTVLGLLVSGLLGGVVVVEYVFNYLGIGYLAAFTAGANSGSPQAWGVLAITFMFGIILMVTNLVVDVAYAFLDPRIRY